MSGHAGGREGRGRRAAARHCSGAARRVPVDPDEPRSLRGSPVARSRDADVGVASPPADSSAAAGSACRSGPAHTCRSTSQWASCSPILSALLAAVLFVGKIIHALRSQLVEAAVALQWEQQVDFVAVAWQPVPRILNPNAGSGRPRTSTRSSCARCSRAPASTCVVRQRSGRRHRAVRRATARASSTSPRGEARRRRALRQRRRHAPRGIERLAGGATACAAVPGAGHLPGRQRQRRRQLAARRFMASTRSRRCLKSSVAYSKSDGANLSAPALPIDILAARALPIDSASSTYDLHYFAGASSPTRPPHEKARSTAWARLPRSRRSSSSAASPRSLDTRTSRWAPPPGLPYESAAALPRRRPTMSLRRHGPFGASPSATSATAGTTACHAPSCGATRRTNRRQTHGLTRLRRALPRSSTARARAEPDVLVFKVRRLYPAAAPASS